MLIDAVEDRCLQTAQPVSIALNVPIYVEHGEVHFNNNYRNVPTHLKPFRCRYRPL